MMKNRSKSVDGNQVTIYRNCTITGEKFSVTVDKESFEWYQRGSDPIQLIFPDLNADEREFLISNNTPAEWDDMFAGLEF